MCCHLAAWVTNDRCILDFANDIDWRIDADVLYDPLTLIVRHATAHTQYMRFCISSRSRCRVFVHACCGSCTSVDLGFSDLASLRMLLGRFLFFFDHCIIVCVYVSFISGSSAYKTNKQTDRQTGKSKHTITTTRNVQILNYLISVVFALKWKWNVG